MMRRDLCVQTKPTTESRLFSLYGKPIHLRVEGRGVSKGFTSQGNGLCEVTRQSRAAPAGAFHEVASFHFCESGFLPGYIRMLRLRNRSPCTIRPQRPDWQKP